MKPFQSIRLRIRLIVGLLVAGLVAVSALSVLHALQQRQQARRVEAIAGVSRDLLSELDLLRAERGATAGLIATPGAPDPDEVRYQNDLRAQSTPKIRRTLARLTAISPASDVFYREEIARRFDRLQALRAESDAALGLPTGRQPPDLHARFIAGVTDLTQALTEATTRLAAEMSRRDAYIARMANIGRLAWTVGPPRATTAWTGGRPISWDAASHQGRSTRSRP